MSARSRSYLLLIFVAAIWGFAAPIIKLTFPSFPPLLFLTYRFFLTCLLMIPVQLLLEKDTWETLGRLSFRDWLMFILSGLLGSTVQLGLLFWGLDRTTSLDGSVINATSPVLVALGGYVVLRERLPRRELIGHLLAFVGTMIIVLQSVFEGQSLFSGSFFGNFLVLLGTIAWVGYVLLTKQQLNHKISPLLLTTNMFVTGFISTSVLVLLSGTSSYAFWNTIAAAPLAAHLGVAYMAYISGALAYFLYQLAQKNITASSANIFLYLSPVFTLPLSYFWLGEPVTPYVIVGSLVIAVGVTISESRRQRLHHVG